ncbi:hypothetical protein [uncultured Actinomyces sp.]|uniref:hypothetical protein n=1 Tax=uncultured Actinomyces sp. TaxID=249061 RepID=UPI0028D2D72B|nr:hypothetical protein [uncultured Actinomyces sp.]
MADMSGLGGFGKHHSSSTFGGVDELLAAIDAQVEESNKAAAGAFEFVERMRDIRGEGESKDHAVRVVVDSSGTPIEVQVPDHPALGHAFLEAFQAARHDVGAGIADAAVEAYGESSTEAQVFVQQYGTRKDQTGESGVAQSGLSRLQQLESDALHRGQR